MCNLALRWAFKFLSMAIMLTIKVNFLRFNFITSSSEGLYWAEPLISNNKRWAFFYLVGMY